MALNKDHGRQYPTWAYQEVPLAELATGVEIEVIDVPRDCFVVDGFVEVTVAWDDTTTAVIDVGDAADPNRYTSTSVNLKALGGSKFAVAGLGQSYPSGGAITATATYGTNDNTVGTVRIGIAYIMYGRAHETQPY